MKHLVLFGDSQLGRFGKEWILKLEEKLPGYDVYNCAAGGWDTNDAVKKSPYIARLQPEIIVISLGTNDAAPWKQVALGVYKENMELIIKTFGNSKVIVFLPPPVNETKELSEVKRLNSIIKQYHDEAQNVAEKHKASVLNSWDIYMPMLNVGEDYHLEDGIHLNELGNQKLIDNLAKAVNRID